MAGGLHNARVGVVCVLCTARREISLDVVVGGAAVALMSAVDGWVERWGCGCVRRGNAGVSGPGAGVVLA